MTDHRLCIFGEVLFDHFPDGSRVLGGAPFNVAWHLQAFQQSPYFVSRVGADPEGEQIRQSMHEWGMNANGLQTDAHLGTGRVTVSFDDGEPQYDIVHPCAYDAIESPAVAASQLLYHGSLAVRSPTSMQALRETIDAGDGTVFLDVNLRPPWWNSEAIHALLRSADWVKLNADELAQLDDAHAGAPEPARSFIDAHDLKGLILTHGAKGAELLTRDGSRISIAPGKSEKVVDTVGAGDAFASVIILGLLQQWPFETTLQRAQIFASRIVGNRGATVSDPDFYQAFRDDWNL